MSFQDRAQAQVSQLDKELSKYQPLVDFEKQTSVPKVYAVLGLAGLYFFLIFFNIGGEFLVNFAGFIIPGYYSLNALFSASKVDDTQVSCLKIHSVTPANMHTVVDRKPDLTPRSLEYTPRILTCLVLGCLLFPKRY